MTIKLSDFEAGKKYDGDYDADLIALQERLHHIQIAHIIHGKSAIIAFEGWDAAGKGGAISRLTADWDPRYFQVWPIAAPSEEERVRHFLWRFWKRLPGKGELNIFDRTWYGRVLVERVEGYCSEADWRRGYDEINEFEAQQRDNGVSVIKIFLHITQAEHMNAFASGSKILGNGGKRERMISATAHAVMIISKPMQTCSTAPIRAGHRGLLLMATTRKLRELRR